MYNIFHLGSETVVDVWIQISEPRSLPESIPYSSKSEKTDLVESTDVPVKEVELTPERLETTKPNNSQLTNLNIKQESKVSKEENETFTLNSRILIDHDYCYTSSKSQIIENNRTIAHLPNGSTESILQNRPTSVKENRETLHLNGLPIDLNEASLNTNKINMQKLATSMKDTPGKMQPLKISIPQAFEPQNKKQFLVLKNKDVVPVNFDPKSKILIDPVSIERKVNDVNSKMQKQSEDIKSQVNKVMHKRSEKSMLLKINASNSILLTANYSEPALKIAEFTGLQNFTEDFASQHLRLKAGSVNSFQSDFDFTDKSRVGKTKITLGKDKGKKSKKEIYEGVMR